MKNFILALFALLCVSWSGASAQTVAHYLSPADQDVYREIFDIQQSGQWARADQLIDRLDDKILLGHVYHQRYMHPTAYRSSYAELKRWLDLYADHPNADVIYTLAKKRRPAGAAAPKRFQTRRWRVRGNQKQLHPELTEHFTNSPHQSELRRIEGKVRWHVEEDEPTQALNYISAPTQRRLMTEAQYDRMRSWIAESYYYNDKLDKAMTIASEVAQRHGDKAPLAYWVAGLISYRRGNITEAASYFSQMAQIPWQEEGLRSGAAYWAARTNLAIGNSQAVFENLQLAAQYPYSFYGQLALGQLGQQSSVSYSAPSLSQEQWQDLAAKSRRLKRAVALVEVGQKILAQEELRWTHGELTDDDDPALIALSFDLHLYAAQLDMALSSDISPQYLSYLQAALYPVPDYVPNGGFTLDRSVLFGVIRQESKFRTQARSRSGAAGLMQLMPRTAAYISGDRSVMRSARRASDELYEPGFNMQLGQSYISELLTRYTDNDLMEMAIAYNWGPGNLRRWKQTHSISDPLLLIESVPDSQARNFVDHVMTNIWVYRARLDQPAPSRDAVAAGGRAVYQPIDF
ncbi:MAG: lytic transglycosylase domain-containing protein [bacterium]